jgi:RWD domain
LKTLGVVESDAAGNDREERENLNDNDEDDDADSVDDTFGSQEMEDLLDNDDGWMEQAEARRGAAMMHYEEYQEDMDVDSDQIMLGKIEDDLSENASEILSDSEFQDMDSINKTQDDFDSDRSEEARDDPMESSKAFLHLTQNLSFSRDQASRACQAIDGWDEAAATESTKRSSKSIGKDDDNRLEFAMDWLCLHLSEAELTHGFRPNPNPPKQQPRTSVAAKVKAVPHPSISVISKPIAEQAKEWADSLRLQERTIALMRLGFHHAEALQACDETIHRMNDDIQTTSSAEQDPAIPLLLNKLAQDVQQGDGSAMVSTTEEYGDDTQEILQEERAQELEALEAIYAEQIQVHPSSRRNLSKGHIIARYMITIKPLETLQPPARNEECMLHVLIQDGYPLHNSPLLLFVNASLPPTLLRRINVILVEKALSLVGNPVVFEIVSYLEAELPVLHNDFVKEQRRKEFEAEQVRLLRQRQTEIDQAQKIMEAQYHAQYDPNGEGAKLGRRQKAKLKAAEKAYDRPDQMEQLYKEYRQKQDTRVEHARQQNSQVRATYAQLAIQRRQEELIQDEAERAGRSAMVASLNRGESMETARDAAKRARLESLRENGVEVDEDYNNADGARQEQIEQSKSGNPEMNIQSAHPPKPTNTSATFMDRLRNTANGSQSKDSILDNSNENLSQSATPDSRVVKTSKPTEQTSAFMDRLREMYEKAAKEKRAGKQTTKAKADTAKMDYYHLESPETDDSPETEGHSSKVPRPVAVATGELVEVMKDIIIQQEEQPWLVSDDARAPTLIRGRQKVTSAAEKLKCDISVRLRQDLERKRKLARDWSEKNGESFKERVEAKEMKREKEFSPETYHRLMKQRQR